MRYYILATISTTFMLLDVFNAAPCLVDAGMRFSHVRPSFIASTKRKRSCSKKTKRVKLAQVTDALDVSKGTGYRELYPPLVAHTNGTIRADSLHTLHYQEYGLTVNDTLESPTTTRTALFLHGGPGAGCTPNHARFFDPSRYRVVLLDQRGSGKSTPRGEVRNNTLSHLVSDCELLRAELGIRKWDVVMGGSWGSTLALAYAQAHPQFIGSLILRGLCTMRPIEIDHLFSVTGGAATLYPKGWSNFEAAVLNNGEMHRRPRDTLHAYYDRLLGGDEVSRLSAARSWFMWEMTVTASMKKKPDSSDNSTDEKVPPSPVFVWESETGWSYEDIRGARISLAKSNDVHVELIQSLRRFPPSTVSKGGDSDATTPRIRPVKSFNAVSSRTSPQSDVSNLTANVTWIPAQPMITSFYSVNAEYAINTTLISKDRVDRIRGIPCIAVHGELDMVCPVDTALDLLELWPEMELRIPTSGGHSMYDPPIMHELLQATDQFANQKSNSCENIE